MSVASVNTYLYGIVCNQFAICESGYHVSRKRSMADYERRLLLRCISVLCILHRTRLIDHGQRTLGGRIRGGFGASILHSHWTFINVFGSTTVVVLFINDTVHSAACVFRVAMTQHV